MLKEVLSYLAIKPGHWYIDCNLGGGGHTRGILEAGGKVLGKPMDISGIGEFVMFKDTEGNQVGMLEPSQM